MQKLKESLPNPGSKPEMQIERERREGALADVISLDDALLEELSYLSQLLQRREMGDYWDEATRLIHSRLNTEGASLCLLQGPRAVSEIISRHGDPSEASLVRVQRWETTLNSAPTSEFQATGSDELELGIGRRKGDLPIIHVRLRANGLLHGGISLIFPAEELPSPEQYVSLTHFIHLVVDPGLQARQVTITQERLEHVSLIAQVGQSLNSTLKLETVLQETTEMTAYALGAEAATLFLTDERASELVFYVPTGTAGGLLRETRIPMSQGVAGWVATNRRSIIVNDTRKDYRFSSQVDAETGFHTQNILCVPLLSQGRLVGVLEVLNKEREEGFSDEDQSWLETMANQAAVALENARLYENLRQEQERIIRAQEEVRHQLARDLHDGAAQMLSLIIMNVDVTRRLLDRERYETVRSELDLLEDLGRQANREIRTLLFELRPIILESQGLIPALRSYHQQLQNSVNSEIHLEVEELDFSLTGTAASNIFSVVQEAMNNIRKHAHAAANVWIRVKTEETDLIFEVEDDGGGFDVRTTQEGYDTRGSFGLLNMHERMEMLGGKLTITSPSPRINRGALIRGRAPISRIDLAQFEG